MVLASVELTGELEDQELSELYDRLRELDAEYQQAQQILERKDRVSALSRVRDKKEIVWNKIRERKALIQAGGSVDVTPAMEGGRLAQWDRV